MPMQILVSERIRNPVPARTVFTIKLVGRSLHHKNEELCCVAYLVHWIRFIPEIRETIVLEPCLREIVTVYCGTGSFLPY